MATGLSDIVDVDEVEREIAAGYINRRLHPDFPLAILAYSDTAQFDNHWTDTVRACRGLIYNTETNEVVARPFAKFFNFDQNEAPNIGWDQMLYHWANKEDGSLGIVYRPHFGGELAVATRGSFESDQAKHATRLLQEVELEHDNWADLIDQGYTPLVEIVYPENRIVLDYGDRDELIFLGAISIETGAFYPEAAVQTERRKFSDLQRNLSRSNAEGWVAWLNPWKAVKIKQADYLELHRIISHLSVKEIWRQLRDGTLHEFMVALPDEFQQWARDMADPLIEQQAQIVSSALAEYGNMPKNASRKEFAEIAKLSPHARYLFALLDGKDINPIAWQAVEPVGNEYKE